MKNQKFDNLAGLLIDEIINPYLKERLQPIGDHKYKDVHTGEIYIRNDGGELVEYID